MKKISLGILASSFVLTAALAIAQTDESEDRENSLEQAQERIHRQVNEEFKAVRLEQLLKLIQPDFLKKRQKEVWEARHAIQEARSFRLRYSLWREKIEEKCEDAGTSDDNCKDLQDFEKKSREAALEKIDEVNKKVDAAIKGIRKFHHWVPEPGEDDEGYNPPASLLSTVESLYQPLDIAEDIFSEDPFIAWLDVAGAQLPYGLDVADQLDSGFIGGILVLGVEFPWSQTEEFEKAFRALIQFYTFKELFDR